MWELKAATVALCLLFFAGFVPAMVPHGWRLALPPTAVAVIYLMIGITIGVLLT